MVNKEKAKLEPYSEPFVALRPSKSGEWVEFGAENPRKSKLKTVWIEYKTATDAFGMISFDEGNETPVLVNISRM